MNIVQLLSDYRIPFRPPNSRKFVELGCCWCSDTGEHLGIHAETGICTCWKCGVHGLPQTVARLLKVPTGRAYEIIQKYGGKGSRETIQKEANKVIRIGDKHPFQFPSGCGDIHPVHRKYLEGRGFDVERILHEWRIMGCSPVGKLDGMDFKWRIIVPIVWDERIVSFLARDVTNAEGRIRYLTCPKPREIIPHKTIVYGKEEEWRKNPNEWFVCVEGVTDVWKLGRRAFATFGTQVTKEQIRTIAKTFKRVVITFDNEAQAQIRARKLQAELRFRGIECRIELPPLNRDPGAMSEREAEVWIKKATQEHTKRSVLPSVSLPGTC